MARAFIHVISFDLISSHLISCHVMSCHVISCHVMSCHLISSHLISSHLISSPLISLHLINSSRAYSKGRMDPAPTPYSSSSEYFGITSFCNNAVVLCSQASFPHPHLRVPFLSRSECFRPTPPRLRVTALSLVFYCTYCTHPHPRPVFEARILPQGQSAQNCPLSFVTTAFGGRRGHWFQDTYKKMG